MKTSDHQKEAMNKVAIITRTKDRPMLLERAIKSLEAQTYKDYVHVILNDGGSAAEIEQLIKDQDKSYQERVQIVHNKKSVGHTKALNQAIRHSKSEYIAILDDDDTWHKDRLEKTISYLDSTQNRAVVVKMDIVIEEIHGDTIKYISQELHPQSGEGEISLYKQCRQNYLSNGIITYQRSLFEELNGYDETLEVAEDWDFGIRLMLKSDVGFLRDEESLFFYHQRPSQLGVSGNSVHANVRQQEEAINTIRNKYLREDIQAGKLGVGYIMNNLEQEDINLVRIERHVNQACDNLQVSLESKFDARIAKIDYLARLKAKIRN